MRNHWAWFGVGLLCVAAAVWQLMVSQHGLKVITLSATNPPATVITPANIPPASRPTVLIAHGFAGSAVLMRGFALTLAHAGYTTVSWDFEGHGGNPNPLKTSSESNSLLQDAESALAEAEKAGLIDTQRVAILGHSMGSGVALAYGVNHPDTYATIAISPVSQSATPNLPHNLLLMAGSLEPQFVANADSLLFLAGGERDTLVSGTARKLEIIPNVEHISILFSPTAHATARTWLDGTFGVQPGATDYIDRRLVWFGLGIVGFLSLSVGGINSLPSFQVKPGFRPSHWLGLIALVGGSLLGTILLWLVSKAGVSLNQPFGLLVGGYIVLWFGVSGLVALIIQRPHISRPNAKDLIKALIAFLALWFGVGLLGNFVWLPWLLIPARLALWIPASIITLPWFLAAGEAASSSKPAGQIGWWLVQMVAVIGGLYLSIILTSGLGFIFLILPVIPIMLALHSLAVSPKHGSWAYALPGAMFTAWLLLAVFPLQ
ncbi:MAG TPA: alpha/beta fold hydrolase [Anaerolineales bacterium]|nr:alpha/beta fold hydrolase [Anaerolineales bacterium]